MGKHKSAALPSVWSSEAPFSNFSSGITCIKKVGRHASDAPNTNVQQALYPKFAAASILYIVIAAVIAHNFLFVFSWSLGPLTL